MNEGTLDKENNHSNKGFKESLQRNVGKVFIPKLHDSYFLDQCIMHK